MASRRLLTAACSGGPPGDPAAAFGPGTFPRRKARPGLAVGCPRPATRRRPEYPLVFDSRTISAESPWHSTPSYSRPSVRAVSCNDARRAQVRQRGGDVGNPGAQFFGRASKQRALLRGLAFAEQCEILAAKQTAELHRLRSALELAGARARSVRASPAPGNRSRAGRNGMARVGIVRVAPADQRRKRSLDAPSDATLMRIKARWNAHAATGCDTNRLHAATDRCAPLAHRCRPISRIHSIANGGSRSLK